MARGGGGLLPAALAYLRLPASPYRCGPEHAGVRGHRQFKRESSAGVWVPADQLGQQLNDLCLIAIDFLGETAHLASVAQLLIKVADLSSLAMRGSAALRAGELPYHQDPLKCGGFGIKGADDGAFLGPVSGRGGMALLKRPAPGAHRARGRVPRLPAAAEPDLALLADLHERKARAFRLWADVSGDGSLRHEAHRAEKAAQTPHEMHANRTSQPAGNTAAGDQPVVERLLTRQQAGHARTVLDYVQAHAPYPEAEVRLAVLMLTLRAARAGTGNVTGQDLTGWLPDDAEQVVQRLVAADWLCSPGTVAEVMASRSEDPVAVAVPALLPEQPRPFTFGKTTRGRISGWDQKVVGDRKIRKKKLGATTRLLALYTAAHTRPDGRVGHAEDGGLHLDQTAAFTALPHNQIADAELLVQIAEHAELLVAADWLTEAGTAGGRLRGQLAERVLPLGGLL